jgi:hypothetical protein
MKKKAKSSHKNTGLYHSKTPLPMNKFSNYYRAALLICISLITGVLIIQQACSNVVPAENYEGSEIVVPVTIESTADVGSIYFEVIYSSRMLEATGVEKGTIATDSILEYSIDAHDRVIIGFIDSSGFQGDGTLATISLRIMRADKNDLPLRIDNVLAHSADSMAPLKVEVSEGSVNTAKKSFNSPVLRISAGGE